MRLLTSEFCINNQSTETDTNSQTLRIQACRTKQTLEYELTPSLQLPSRHRFSVAARDPRFLSHRGWPSLIRKGFVHVR
ncbi:Hypothetical predicted protein [Podarcis lilfordi]|uniref:Uncharacterized protein n=1 Tax=Podarcis lilfordi TaxID=74358 RepID=A0AA35K8T5_9SAUR|nr:Hypothetical predicted protein [Podarcis lilfordi]